MGDRRKYVTDLAVKQAGGGSSRIDKSKYKYGSDQKKSRGEE